MLLLLDQGFQRQPDSFWTGQVGEESSWTNMMVLRGRSPNLDFLEQHIPEESLPIPAPSNRCFLVTTGVQKPPVRSPNSSLEGPGREQTITLSKTNAFP